MIQSLYPFAKKWSQNGSIWIFSDTHFDDEDCLLMDKNWISPTEQIKTLKKYCHKNDTLVLLGDIGNPEYLRQIRSYKVLITGNHDAGLSNYEDYFDEMYDGPVFISPKILLSHEPVDLPFVYNIHGHVHDRKEKDNLHLNVAANIIGYTPVNLGKIIKNGVLKNIPSLHRMTIDAQTEKKKTLKNEEEKQ